MPEVMVIKDSKNMAYTFPRSDYRKSGESVNKKLPEMRKSFSLNELHEIHHEIARRLVLGQKPKDICKDLNLSYTTVINVKNMPMVQEQLSILGGARDQETIDVAKQIRDLAPACVGVLKGIIENDEVSDAIKLKTSLAVLDRAGHGVTKNVNVKGVHAVVSAADIKAIQQRAIEIGIESGVIDVEPE